MASAFDMAPALPTPIEAWQDSTGAIHGTKSAALTVEIERVLGRTGNGGSLTPGLAQKIIEQRELLVPLLQAFGPVARMEDVTPAPAEANAV